MRKVCNRTGRSCVGPGAAKVTELRSLGRSMGISVCACDAPIVGESAVNLSGTVGAAGLVGATVQQPSSQDCASKEGAAVAGALMWSRLEQHSIAAR